MTTDTNHHADEDLGARILDEDVERASAQIGIPVPARVPAWVLVPDASSISHFAFGYGDDNPLWHDPAYGPLTRWGGQIAPPLYPIACGVDIAPPIPEESKPLFRGLFRGVGKYYSGVEWEWYRPIHAGDPVYYETSTSDVSERESSFSGGRVVTETFQTLYVNRIGEPIAVRRESYVNAERGGSRKSGKNAAVERQEWSPEALAEIDACYAAERPRGADARLAEDVATGDALPRLAKGPLTTVDIISMHMGMGWGGYGQGPLRLAWAHRQRMPAFYTRDRFGVPQVVQRLHWEEDRARELGIPAPYDYGQMRASWLSHVVTDWMGDDGWLWKLGCQARGFNFHGDVHWCTGEVTGSGVLDDGTRFAEALLTATNQRGDVTAPGRATVLLPSRAAGPVRLPRPPADLAERGARLVAEWAARRRGRA